MTYTLALTDRACSSRSLRGWLLFAKLQTVCETDLPERPWPGPA